MERFILHESSSLLLYGAASLGTLFCNALSDSKYHVEGFMDKRADEIEKLQGKKVYSVSDAAGRFSCHDIVVVISVKNVFEHSRIAMELCKKGFKNIIYKPYGVLNGTGTREEEELAQIYDKLLQGDFQYGVSLSCTKENGNKISIVEKYLIEDKEDCHTVFLSLLSLFENEDGQTQKQERNVLFFFPHIQFFKFLQGDVKASGDYYISYCETAAKTLGSFRITEAWRENIIRNRTQIYQEMNQAFIFNRDFFRVGAPDVAWNEKGYFNLVSGKHRAAFFASKSVAFIPVKMGDAEYAKWLNKKETENVLEILRKNDVIELKAPVEHPCFYQYPCPSESFFYGLCFVLAEKISRLFYRVPLDNYVFGKYIYLCLEDYGLLGRFFKRCGADVYENRCADVEISEALDKLFYMDPLRRGAERKKYDIAIVKIDQEEEIRAWQKKEKVRHWFFIGPKPELEKFQGKYEFVYGGVVWDKQMMAVYLEESDV